MTAPKLRPLATDEEEDVPRSIIEAKMGLLTVPSASPDSVLLRPPPAAPVRALVELATDVRFDPNGPAFGDPPGGGAKFEGPAFGGDMVRGVGTGGGDIGPAIEDRDDDGRERGLIAAEGGRAIPEGGFDGEATRESAIEARDETEGRGAGRGMEGEEGARMLALLPARELLADSVRDAGRVWPGECIPC